MQVRGRAPFLAASRPTAMMRYRILSWRPNRSGLLARPWIIGASRPTPRLGQDVAAGAVRGPLQTCCLRRTQRLVIRERALVTGPAPRPNVASRSSRRFARATDPAEGHVRSPSVRDPRGACSPPLLSLRLHQCGDAQWLDAESPRRAKFGRLAQPFSWPGAHFLFVNSPVFSAMSFSGHFPCPAPGV